jgi:hypothetical protein
LQGFALLPGTAGLRKIEVLEYIRAYFTERQEEVVERVEVFSQAETDL